ncbi:hypothetical protein MPER_12440, partial [Moniliophthora perniciosa FA553]
SCLLTTTILLYYTTPRMSFTDCSRVSIKGKNTFNHVRGHQVNGTINARTVTFNTGQAVVKRTEHNEFDYVKRGHVISVKNLGSVELNWLWDKSKSWKSPKPIKAQKRICTAEIHPDRQSKYTVIMYEGKDAERIWKQDFQQFSRTKDPLVAQLFGINQSSIPMLIFHDELIPLGHFYMISFWSSVYLTYLVRNNGWRYKSVWMDARGSLCSGPGGPNADWYGLSTDKSLVVPLEAKMLKDDISLQFFCRIGSSVDNSVLQSCTLIIWRDTYLDDLFPWTAEDLHSKNPHDPVWNLEMYPYLCGLWRNPPLHFPMNVIGGLQFDTLYSPSIEAVARWPEEAGSLWKWGQDPWHPSQGLVDETTLDGGLTRFTLDPTQGQDVYLDTRCNYSKLWHVWLSQSSQVFDALNITEGEEDFFFINPPWLTIESTLHQYDVLKAFFNLCDGKPSVEETLPAPSPIYLFLHPLPKSISELVPWRRQPYFWSFDETGQSEMEEEECERWGVPVLTPSEVLPDIIRHYLTKLATSDNV